MAMYSFVAPFRETKFCGVPSYVFDKLVCTAGKKMLRNTDIVHKADDTKLSVSDFVTEIMT
jgi:hypothetical protein